MSANSDWVDTETSLEKCSMRNILKSFKVWGKNKDPEENINVFEEEQYQAVVKELSKQLHAGWRAALPSP